MKTGTLLRFGLLLFVFLFSPLIVCSQSLSINDTTVGFETDGGSGIATFTITKSGTGTASVLYSTSPGTATGGGSCGGTTDFINLTNASVSFSSSETTKNITITVCGDTRDEAEETFLVNLFSPGSGATIGDGQGQATLVDDDPPPSLRINDVTVTEGNAGQANATFTVTLSPASGQNVSVTYATANDTATGSASCGGTADFVNSNNSLSFATGVTTQPIAIAVCGDTEIENNQRFRVNLTNPVNATIQDAQGFGNITSDDNPPLPTLTINDRTVTEPLGPASIVNAVFTLTLTAANPAGATVNFTTVNGTAIRSLAKTCTAPGDFILRGGVLSFGPAEITKTVTIPICHDTVDEPNETFQIQLSSGSGLTIGDATGIGTINDND